MGRPKGSKNGHLTLVDKICENCNKTFQVEPHRANTARFCSRSCLSKTWWDKRGRAESRHETRHCQHCGTAFIVKHNTRKKIYCSRQCSDAEHGATIKKQKKQKQCLICSASFYPERKEQRFCSPKCANKSFERRAPLTCKVCGNTFMVREKFAKKQKTCSRRCRTIWIGKVETKIEKAVAAAMKSRRLKPSTQFPIGPMTVDFAFPDLKLAIECDGTYWHSLADSRKRDKAKDAYLRKLGWNIVRLTETEILHDPKSCVRQITKALSNIDQPRLL